MRDKLRVDGDGSSLEFGRHFSLQCDKLQALHASLPRLSHPGLQEIVTEGSLKILLAVTDEALNKDG